MCPWRWKTCNEICKYGKSILWNKQQTKQAIKDFQRDFNLDVDGIYGKNTDAVLVQVIKEMQQILQCSKIDGMAGNETNENYNNFKGIKHFTRNEFKCKCIIYQILFQWKH
mgnify:CR=1 FL=1